MNAGRNALPAAMLSTPHRRISFTNRSCSVPLARSTRPLACEELAQMMSMFSACRARPNWVMPSPPIASFLLTRNTLVGIERHRLAMALQITLQSLEICKRALGWDKAKLHQSAGGVIDEHQKRAARRPIFEPAMVRTVDLDQLAEMLTAMTRLLDASALRPGQPDSGLPHPAAQRLSRHPHIMALA